MEATYKKTKQIFLGLIIFQFLLVGTHLGEFWPFSIFPMFSKAGKTWTRSLVRDVSKTPADAYWTTHTHVDQLPGEKFPMDEVNINTNDVSNTIEKVAVWDDEAKASMQHLFKSALPEKELMVYRVNGSLVKNEVGEKEVQLTYTPFILLSESESILNPKNKSK